MPNTIHFHQFLTLVYQGIRITNGMSADAFMGFYNKAKDHAELGRRALNENNPEKATDLWRTIFGDRFPDTQAVNNKDMLSEAFASHPLHSQTVLLFLTSQRDLHDLVP